MISLSYSSFKNYITKQRKQRRQKPSPFRGNVEERKQRKSVAENLCLSPQLTAPSFIAWVRILLYSSRGTKNPHEKLWGSYTLLEWTHGIIFGFSAKKIPRMSPWLYCFLANRQSSFSFPFFNIFCNNVFRKPRDFTDMLYSHLGIVHSVSILKLVWFYLHQVFVGPPRQYRISASILASQAVMGRGSSYLAKPLASIGNVSQAFCISVFSLSIARHSCINGRGSNLPLYPLFISLGSFISKCKCTPDEKPVVPICPISCIGLTISPVFTLTLLMCP